VAKPTNNKLRHLVQEATTGNAQSQLYLGWAYVEGKIVDKDDQEGSKWLELAANNGSLEAKFRLALLLLSQRNSEAINILIGLNSQGFFPAAYELGYCYYMGSCVDRNVEKAKDLWEKASIEGHVLAKINLLKLELRVSPYWKRPIVYMKLLILFTHSVKMVMSDLSDVRLLGSAR
jgi:TPR repeat protein